MSILLLPILLAAASCEPAQLDTNTIYAEAILKKNLLSPSSYVLIGSETIWTGKSEEAHPARVVEIHYDSQNAFGATIRQCSWVAFKLEGANYTWIKKNAVSACGNDGQSGANKPFFDVYLISNGLDPKPASPELELNH